MRRSDRAGWASRDAALACPATVSRRRIWRQFECRQDFCQKKPGPEPFIDQHHAFAVPADSRLRGMIALQDWPCIDITLLFSVGLSKEDVDLVHLRRDHLVIIVAPSVARDCSCRCSRGPVGRIPLKIIERQNNDRLRAGKTFCGSRRFSSPRCM